MLVDCAGAQKQQGFGDRVKGHVQGKAESTKRASDAERRNHDSGMIDCVISQQTPEVSLNQHEGHRDAH